MLLSASENLEDFIVRTLAARPSASVSELHEYICGSYRRYSTAALYKELRKLQEQGVVVRRKDQLSLSLSWVFNLVELCDSMYDTHIAAPSAGEILPEPGEIKSFTFSTLAKVDDFWVHAMLIMLQHSKTKRLFQWIPHPWFYLVNSHKSFPFHNALRTAGARIDNIIGGNTFLDRYGQRITTAGVYELNYAPSKFQDIRNLYFSVSDTYMLTVHLSKRKAEEIDAFYDSIRSIDQVDVPRVVDLTTRDARTKVTIERKPAKVRKTWNRFIDYFEVSTELKL